MTSLILNIPMIEVLRIWGELVEAEHGVNGYGGDTAELYAYRFCGDSPTRRLQEVKGKLRTKADKAAAMEARETLYSFLSLFEKVKSVKCEVDGKTLWDWFQTNEPFDHRVHVRVF